MSALAVASLAAGALVLSVGAASLHGALSSTPASGSRSALQSQALPTVQVADEDDPARALGFEDAPTPSSSPAPIPKTAPRRAQPSPAPVAPAPAVAPVPGAPAPTTPASEHTTTPTPPADPSPTPDVGDEGGDSGEGGTGEGGDAGEGGADDSGADDSGTDDSSLGSVPGAFDPAPADITDGNDAVR
jgi:hypothetical protein